jgi:hypothetical protein
LRKVFEENTIVVAHPSKSGSDWWYGTSVADGRSGFFPKTYVQVVQPGTCTTHASSLQSSADFHFGLSVTAKAIYGYTGTNADELSFAEGDDISVIDTRDADWWKAEHNGAVFIVPASYVEVIEG